MAVIISSVEMSSSTLATSWARALTTTPLSLVFSGQYRDSAMSFSPSSRLYSSWLLSLPMKPFTSVDWLFNLPTALTILKNVLGSFFLSSGSFSRS